MIEGVLFYIAAGIWENATKHVDSIYVDIIVVLLMVAGGVSCLKALTG